ncbi:L-serine dehydratase, beta chain [bioreactor metagenome]|uniref:L-serine dehydratase, beta chain n=1 Tax=bioreactor metagenome TaxID=1076179 RepID=A0A645CD90_9ZZZZ|nr:L-serine ammonia-lyase, iron-sulfur-dependent subunit beta [Oscillibacter sp.]MEA4993790.1 L-serine ammonia-lyase, iron-sulfur-dependent subunit beta [Oscillibacter sp.]
MLDIFDILGPIMVGPSSSHTAGAVRIGNMARSLLGGEPKTANIGLHGSFAETGPGHGTDRALVAGLLGMRPDDLRIPRSFELAEKEGLEVSFRKVELKEAHPNTAVLSVSDGNGRTLELQAASTGGGRIRVDALDGIHVNFTGIFNTLIIRSIDVPGKLAEVTWILEHGNVNIANMNLWRAKRGGSVLMVIETDEKVSPKVRTLIGELEDVTGVTYYEREDA